MSTHARKSFLEPIVAEDVRPTDGEVIVRFVTATRHLPLRAVATICGRDKGTVQRYRTAVTKHEPPGGLNPATRAKMEEYLFSHGGAGGTYREGLQAAIQEMRDKLEEMERRLTEAAVRDHAILSGGSVGLVEQSETENQPGEADSDERAGGGQSA